MITEVPGVRVGHWTDRRARTGCTVILFPEGTVGSGEIRGGAPATREFALLDPLRTVTRLDAVVLSGGSAFGLAAADGVMARLEQAGVGVPTAAGPVPIVVGLSLFDLLVGDPSVRPGPAAGAAAYDAATTGPTATGAVGAGCGATVGSWRGRDRARPSGLGTATVRHGPVLVAALVAVNAYGDLAEPASRADHHPALFDTLGAGPGLTDTTIGVVATNAALDKAGCHLVAQAGHDGMARALVPAHTRLDGDALVVAATGEVHAGLDLVRELGSRAVEEAIRRSVGPQ